MERTWAVKWAGWLKVDLCMQRLGNIAVVEGGRGWSICVVEWKGARGRGLDFDG